jgi:hypothetical protein
MRIVNVVAAMILVLLAGHVFADCPGNVLTGDHWQETGPRWTWTLNSETGKAEIRLAGSSSTGDVAMICSRGKWAAHLFNMTEPREFNCFANLVGNALQNGGHCFTSDGKIVNINGTFTPRPR